MTDAADTASFRFRVERDRLAKDLDVHGTQHTLACGMKPL